MLFRSKSKIEGRNSKKEVEVKRRGRKLTLGFREEGGSGLMNKRTDECSAERKFREWRVKK